jgi:hypothetical protein
MRAVILILAVSFPAAAAAQGGFTPRSLSSLAIPGYANNVDVSGNYAFVAAGSAGLMVVNVANPYAPVIIAALDTPGNANDVRVFGSLAYIADGASGLRIIDVANPNVPVAVGALDTPGEANDVIVSGDLAFVADGVAGIQIIDVSNPESPTLVRTVDTPGTARGVDVEGSTLVVADDGQSGLRVIDVTIPGEASIVGILSVPGSGIDVDLAGTHAYMANYTTGMLVIDVSLPTAPVAVGSLPGSPPAGLVPRDVEVAGQFALFAEQSYASASAPIVDISVPAAPVVRDVLNFFLDYAGTGIALRGPYVYWTGQSFVVSSENGTTGSTRLFIGQYLGTVLVTLESWPNPSIEGNEVMLTASVSSPPGTPTGTVEFFDGATSLGTAPLVGGTTALAISTLSVGSHSLTARYSGDQEYAPGDSAPLTQVVDAATFALTVAITGAGAGTVTSDDGLITCPGDCEEAYGSGSLPTLTATAGADSAFTSWSGDCTGADPCTLTMDADKSVTATFALTGPDLLVAAVSDPVALASPGSAYGVTDTTTNQGAVLAGRSTTHFYLSLDAVRSADDRRLTGRRPVPPLGAGVSSTRSTKVTIPRSLAPGVYWQLACADAKTAVAESNELDNCLASTGTIQVDLRKSTVGDRSRRLP